MADNISFFRRELVAELRSASGESILDIYPGLPPWAKFFRRFAAEFVVRQQCREGMRLGESNLGIGTQGCRPGLNSFAASRLDGTMDVLGVGSFGG